MWVEQNHVAEAAGEGWREYRLWNESRVSDVTENVNREWRR